MITTAAAPATIHPITSGSTRWVMKAMQPISSRASPARQIFTNRLPQATVWFLICRPK